MGVIAADSRLSYDRATPVPDVEMIKFWAIQPETFVGFAGDVIMAIDIIRELYNFTDPMKNAPIEKFLPYFFKKLDRRNIRGLGEQGCELIFLDMPNQRPQDPSPFRFLTAQRVEVAISGEILYDEHDRGGMGCKAIGSGTVISYGDAMDLELQQNVNDYISDLNRITAVNEGAVQRAAAFVASAMSDAISLYPYQDVGGRVHYATISPWGVSAAPLTLGSHDENPPLLLAPNTFEDWLRSVNGGAPVAAGVYFA